MSFVCTAERQYHIFTGYSFSHGTLYISSLEEHLARFIKERINKFSGMRLWCFFKKEGKLFDWKTANVNTENKSN